MNSEKSGEMQQEPNEKHRGNVPVVKFFKDGDRLKPTVKYETVDDIDKVLSERPYLLSNESQYIKLRDIKEKLSKIVPQLKIEQEASDLWAVVRVEDKRRPDQHVDQIYKKLHDALAEAGFSIIGFDSDSYEDGVEEEVIINHGLIVDTKKYQEYKDQYQEKK